MFKYILLFIFFLTSCSSQQVMYDPFSEIRAYDIGNFYQGEPERPELITPNRRQLDSYRYWHDMQEAENLLAYRGIKESYRFMFDGDCEPFIVIRINHWQWSNKYSISLRLKMNDAYDSSSCIFDPNQPNPMSCPKTVYKRIENFEINESTWKQFKSKVENISFFNYKPEEDPELSNRKIFLTHGTSWSFEGLLKTNDDLLENTFKVNTPPQGQLYDIGEFLLEVVGEEKWLAETKNVYK